jgi:hypothetical protein
MLLSACRSSSRATRYPSERVPSGMNLVDGCGTLGVTNVARFFVRHVPARRQTETPCLSFIESVVHVGPRAGNLHEHGLKVRLRETLPLRGNCVRDGAGPLSNGPCQRRHPSARMTRHGRVRYPRAAAAWRPGRDARTFSVCRVIRGRLWTLRLNCSEPAVHRCRESPLTPLRQLQGMTSGLP